MAARPATPFFLAQQASRRKTALERPLADRRGADPKCAVKGDLLRKGSLAEFVGELVGTAIRGAARKAARKWNIFSKMALRPKPRADRTVACGGDPSGGYGFGFGWF